LVAYIGAGSVDDHRFGLQRFAFQFAPVVDFFISAAWPAVSKASRQSPGVAAVTQTSRGRFGILAA